MAATPAYLIITPARNEGRNLPATIDSVVSQTVRPRLWVIVDDGSTDETGPLIDAAARQHSWIKAVHRPDRGFRKQGGGVIETFYDGFKLVNGEPWEFLVKLDGDLSFPSDYFEKCLAQFAADSKLGVGGGCIYSMIGGVAIEDSPGDPPFHVRGATKIYRRATWEGIGGLIRAPGWDSLDELKANMLGWKTRSFRDLRLFQQRGTGAVDGSWKTAVKNGRANYVVGYHPLFLICKCARRVWERPYGVVATGLLYGYFSGYFSSRERIREPEVIRYIRRQQLNRLFLRDSIWGRK